ncbi:MAG: hypothetical protein ACYTEL_14580 [Planctomycetota bacterium]|jgi:hypothetical protein
MTFDQLQKTWQSQQTGFQLTIDSDMLLREVKRNKNHFESVVFWRDVREVGIAFAMFLFFVYAGVGSSAWPLLVLALLVLFVGVFLLADRIVQKRRMPNRSRSLTSCIEGSLQQVKHQVWLLKNVFWWYLLPPGVGIAVFVSYSAWDARDHLGWFTFDIACMIVFTLFVWWVWRLNQKAVRKELLPRKQELEKLLNALKNAHD